MLNRSFVFQEIENYFQSIGITATALNDFVTESEISDIVVKKLPNVCVVKKNRDSRSKKSKQTHIHITGDSRYAFYDEIIKATSDERIDLLILNANLSHLNFLEPYRKSSLDNDVRIPDMSYHFPNQLAYLKSHTVKKISKRGLQVQLSKVRRDGEAFKELRSYTFKDDVMLFLKLKNSEDFYIVIVIPEFPMPKKSKDVFIKLVDQDIEGSKEETSDSGLLTGRNSLVKTTSKKIAKFNSDTPDEENLVDIASSIKSRSERTNKHQEIVRRLAKKLEDKEADVYEGVIDCLALTKEGHIVIFEVKTLDGGFGDEVSQVRKALSQLLYYEEISLGEFSEYPIKSRIALFDSPIQQQHIDLLEKYKCFVLWLENDELCGTVNALEIFEGI